MSSRSNRSSCRCLRSCPCQARSRTRSPTGPRPTRSVSSRERRPLGHRAGRRLAGMATRSRPRWPFARSDRQGPTLAEAAGRGCELLERSPSSRSGVRVHLRAIRRVRAGAAPSRAIAGCGRDGCPVGARGQARARVARGVCLSAAARPRLSRLHVSAGARACTTRCGGCVRRWLPGTALQSASTDQPGLQLMPLRGPPSKRHPRGARRGLRGGSARSTASSRDQVAQVSCSRFAHDRASPPRTGRHEATQDGM